MKATLTLACILFSRLLMAQPEKLSTFDLDWKPAKEKKAAYLVVVSHDEAGNLTKTSYNLYGPMISQEHYADKAGTIRHGRCSYYFPDGAADSTGNFKQGKEDGSWYYYREDGKLIRKKDYREGVLLQDSLLDQSSDAHGLNPQTGEPEALFDAKGWTSFLIHNLRYPARAADASVTGTVHVQFQVDENGKVLAPFIKKSVEYSLDQEALRLVGSSPSWEPAMRNGQAVASTRVQNIQFRLSGR